MADQNNDPVGPDFAQIAPALKEAMAGMLTCQQGVQRSMAAIRQSLDSSGTKGAVHRDMLIRKIEALRNLSALCNKGAKRLAVAAAKATQECSEQKVLTELQGVSRFMADQLHSEQTDARRILSGLCGKGPQAIESPKEDTPVSRTKQVGSGGADRSVRDIFASLEDGVLAAVPEDKVDIGQICQDIETILAVTPPHLAATGKLLRGALKNMQDVYHDRTAYMSCRDAIRSASVAIVAAGEACERVRKGKDARSLLRKLRKNVRCGGKK